MNLTSSQLNALRLDLQQLANIEYNDVLSELLDHYATLTEQKMETGLSFSDASKWAWAELGSGEGLQAIQDDYVKNIQRQIGSRHIDIVKSYFRWPTFVTTALVGILVYLTVPLMSADILTVGFCLLALTPIGITIWGYRQSVDQHGSSGPIVFKYMQRRGGLSVHLIQVFYVYEKPSIYLQTHTTALVIFCLLLLLYTISFMQLFRDHFAYKPKVA